MDKQRAVIYVRSSDRRRIDEQVNEMVDYCFQKGWIIVGIITDTSKANKANRPKIRKLLRIAKRNEADIVAIECYSRVSRKMQVVDETLELLHCQNLKLHVAEADMTIGSVDEWRDKIMGEKAYSAWYAISHVLKEVG